jgi:hypothetical protein
LNAICPEQYERTLAMIAPLWNPILSFDLSHRPNDVRPSNFRDDFGSLHDIQFYLTPQFSRLCAFASWLNLVGCG